MSFPRRAALASVGAWFTAGSGAPPASGDEVCNAASCAGSQDPACVQCSSDQLLLQKSRRLSSTTASGGNPFEGKQLYVNPSYSASLEQSVASATGDVKATMESMAGFSSAYWLDNMGKIRGTGTGSMQGILTDAASKSPPQLVTFIVYDLPNRDCHAKASNGEICCTEKPDGKCDYLAQGDCAAGLAKYKAQYIDEIAAVLQDFEGRVPVVLVIEPDSLPNLSTNRGDPRCGNSATVAAYQQGIQYAIQKLATVSPSTSIYQDAGHGGWLGWKNNMQDFVSNVRDMQVSQHLRGFATNVAGYQALGKMCPTYDYCLNNAHPGHECCYDPCGLTSQWNPSHNEVNYAQHLRKAMSEGIQGFIPHMIIDTGRNGVDNERQECKHWCNIRGAGVGRSPTTETADKDVIDAYFWLKTPGESDGCTQELPTGGQCPRFDADCASPDSIGTQAGEPRAPEAGQWFDYQIKQLAAKAKMSA